MPWEYERDDARRQVLIGTTGLFTLADVFAVVDRHRAESIWGYGMVYDLPGWVGVPMGIEIQQAADDMQRQVGSRPRGPIAVIASMPMMLDMVQKYRRRNSGALDIETVDTLEVAARWLDERTAPGRPRR